MSAEPTPAAALNETVERGVVDLVAALAPRGGPSPGPDAELADLGYDSLACADLALALEERFGFRLAEADLVEPRTVGDLTSAIQRKARAVARIPSGAGQLQWFAEAVAGPVFRWQSRLEVSGGEHVPGEGPVILAANHRSMLDVPLLVLASPRQPVIFMAKKELFADPVRRWALTRLGGFPVRREVADIRAIDIGVGVLERGDVLGIYPEGTRSKTGRMLPFLHGAAWMALRVGAPIVPCGIRGTERSPAGRRTLRKRVHVTFGPAMPVEREPATGTRRRKAGEMTGRLLESIETLLT